MFYLIYHNGGGLRIDSFVNSELACFLREFPPLQYVVITGEYIDSNI